MRASHAKRSQGATCKDFTRSGNANGFAFFDFFNTTGIERVNAIAIQQAESDECGDTVPTDKIIVAGRAAPDISEPSEYVWGLVRFCANGWGGQLRDWDPRPNDEYNTYDEPGSVTINFGNEPADELTSWMRRGEPFGLAVEESTQKIVVGGYAFMPMDTDFTLIGTTSHFALARWHLRMPFLRVIADKVVYLGHKLAPTPIR